MRLSFVLVHYHTPDLLAEAVDAIQADLRGSGHQGEIVVVDNGSTPLERSRLETLAVPRIESGANRGYAGALNLGIGSISGEAVFVMNPDVMVLPGCISSLVAALEAGAAAAGPRLFWDRGRRFFLPPTEERTRRAEILARFAGRGDRSAAWCRRRWRRHAHRFWSSRESFATVCLSGALLALRRDALERVGAFDEGFRLYFEEDDWLRRLRRCGLVARFVPGAEAVHYYHQSAAREPKAAVWFQKSATRFRNRYYGRWFTWLMARGSSPTSRLTSPAMLPPERPSIDLSPSWEGGPDPLWLEISPLARGYPAGATELAAPARGPWRFPREIWERLAPGRYFMTVCSAAGVELQRYGFDRAAAETG